MANPPSQAYTIETIMVPQKGSTTPSMPTTPHIPTKETPVGGKYRFSLDALHVPFITSPRKASSSPVKPNIDSTTGHDVAATSCSDGTNDSDTSTALVSAKIDTRSASNHANPMTEQLAPPNELRAKRSALPSSATEASYRASRAVSLHRVSFSPSTEQVAEAREQALSLAALGSEARAQSIKAEGNMHPVKSKARTGFAKWRGLKSKSTSDLTNTNRRLSLDSTLSTSSHVKSSPAERFEDRAALAGAAAAKRRLFRWDGNGIHQSGASDKGKVAKVKMTKHQALAARHAKTLEQVINAGMGLHPVPPRVSSANDPFRQTDASKKKALRAEPIPVVDKSQLKGLKSALLDVKMANNIISELRSMPVPLDALRSGVGKIIPDVQIGTAGEHGQERVLSANLPDTVLEGHFSRDDSEIRKRLDATTEALGAATPAAGRLPIEREAKSAAEEALRKFTLNAEVAASPQKALVTARTSSLPPSAEDGTTPAALQAGLTPVSNPKVDVAKPGARPLKMVCLDCGEQEAHQRHAQHLEAAAGVTKAPAPANEVKGGFNLTSVATGAAAALASVGGFISARSAKGARPPLSKSMSVANLPALQGGQRLMGSAPLQLLMDPIGTAAQNSGAFDVLANVTGTALRATQDMESIHPPIDRMAIFVHWWGFEITLPKASMAYLATAHSVSGAFLSFLQTIAATGGVPELLPFIKYISTYMEVEYKAIQAQDQGHGVCIAGTWFMPLALIPRPWDYPLDGRPPAVPSAPNAQPTSVSFSGSAPQNVPASMPISPSTNDNTAPPKRHAFKKVQPDEDSAIANIAILGKGALPLQPVPPKRNLSPNQSAAIRAARTEKIPNDLSPRHPRSSSVASTKSAKVIAGLTNGNIMAAIGMQSEATLAIVEEMPEVRSLRIKA
ncbi:uncharacterized protein MEPE_01562 [Melanopsichium pennsylvanicum]|uniref:Uncharacterized protein n=2 Tax=Melanopsichium pennsylvanicum TaxID=63383 RepID=A0AAJ4XJH8_9BASI|nr:putative protein [Melanopsichium pennsylvanicum 4]SNX82856.1 uncharacterized protein MEPE_01562 [Melanopsichium pennsylvanicum]